MYLKIYITGFKKQEYFGRLIAQSVTA